MSAEKKRDNIGHECPFRVGEWRVDPAASYIKRGSATSKLEPQVMDVLVYLASHADEVVSREKLEAVVWVNRVVGQDALTDTILKLRKAFYDDPRAPEIVETVSRHNPA
jgi:DNA-binding winged helix-turn-helix (wHTH) protein